MTSGSNKNKKKAASSPPVASLKSPSMQRQSSTGSQKGNKKDGRKKSGNLDGQNNSSSQNLVALSEQTDSNVDEHPFSIGHQLVATYRDGSHRLAKIIERNEKKDGTWQYYVHYHDFNRRMDEWVSGGRIVKLPSEANRMRPAGHGHGHGPSQGGPKNEKENDAATTMDVDESDPNRQPRAPLSPSGGKGKSAGKGSMGFGANDPRAIITTIAELEHDEHEGLDEQSLLEHEEITKVKNINNVLFGQHIMECWYFSPFPKEFYPSGPVECIYMCEFTFRFFKTKNELIRYQSHPSLPRHPPGNEIYRDPIARVSMFEMDGAVEKVYCQNLCYFAKLFLDHKTLYWDVDPFLFYVLCTFDERGFHPVGFFSKEKYSDMGYNLACILTFPSAQRRGFGRFLISFSYELSKKEEKVGSPEKPLSDLGAVSYKSYWASTLLQAIKTFKGDQLSVMDLTKMTSIFTEDVVATLQMLGLLVDKPGGSGRKNRGSAEHETGSAGGSAAGTEATNSRANTPLPGGADSEKADRSAPTQGTNRSLAIATAKPKDVKEPVEFSDYLLYCPKDLIEELIVKYAPSGSGPQVDPDLLHWAPLYVTDPKKDKWSIKAKKDSYTAE